ncbi:hypothetical protein Y032_0021g250 [Ancylostoma ceylanicum]|uniref:Uncharacterized protein n=1 Tax=Ancylostoma ceylanicum TaxID=53326 RepID=A0A016V1B6_9BILA|nr:hypothetical protein Y032_0021g250 [Ancylostoma ceylanicum]
MLLLLMVHQLLRSYSGVSLCFRVNIIFSWSVHCFLEIIELFCGNNSIYLILFLQPILYFVLSVNKLVFLRLLSPFEVISRFCVHC